jgi:hemolysin III
VFRILDHSSIYLLIAGTYTPFTLVVLRGAWGWVLLRLVWTLAVAGIVFKCFSTGRLQALSTAIYVLMGWIAVAAIRPLLRALPWPGFLWLLAGGVLYTGGVVFFVWRRKYSHAIWHLAVLAGSACHFLAVYRYVLSRPA